MLAEDILTEDDWNTLAEILNIVKPFFHFTKHFEGRQLRFCEVIPSIYHLLDQLQAMEEKHRPDVVDTQEEVLPEPQITAADERRPQRAPKIPSALG